MPRENHFRHQRYRHPEHSRFELLTPHQSDLRNPAALGETRGAALRLQRARVSAIVLIHGTFVGNDALGLFRKLARAWPPAGAWLKQSSKQLADALIQDAGNYTPQYAQRLEQAVNQAGGAHIPVQLFSWSGENHHLGRADGAIQLVRQLTRWRQLRPGRILCWGHSHGGNLLALLTNLLGSNGDFRHLFFKTVSRFYRWPGSRHIDTRAWRSARRQLRDPGQVFPEHTFDIVTFGTPVRYGWDTAVTNRLLHFVYHRPSADRRADQAPYPISAADVLQAEHGDFVQQLGIAGTNWAPSIFSWRARLADRGLHRLFQAGVPSRELFTHLDRGGRVADDGQTLLVDYGQPSGPPAQHLAGHAIYTRSEWLAFHLNEVARRFYDDTSHSQKSGSPAPSTAADAITE